MRKRSTRKRQGYGRHLHRLVRAAAYLILSIGGLLVLATILMWCLILGALTAQFFDADHEEKTALFIAGGIFTFGCLLMLAKQYVQKL